MKNNRLVLAMVLFGCFSSKTVDAPTNLEICRKMVERTKAAGVRLEICQFSDGTTCYHLKDGRITCGETQ